MITSTLKDILDNVTRFSDEELKLIKPFFESAKLKKNEVLINEGQFCNTIFLVESGLLRNYYNNNGLDINLSFTFYHQFTTSFEAYINRQPSKIIIQAMEKSLIWIIHIREFSNTQRHLLLFQLSYADWQ